MAAVLIGVGVAAGPTVVATYRSPASGEEPVAAGESEVAEDPVVAGEPAADEEPTASSGSRVRPDTLTRPARPLRFRSDGLGITARVVPVDAAAGVLRPPDDAGRLGWWRGGARPGDGEGRVLVTGHTVHTGGGAFDELEQLEPGDVVTIGTRAGRRSYRVDASRYLDIDRFARRAPRLLRQDGPERLVLVTCDGWDGVTYEGSTVVVATPVEPGPTATR